MQDTPWQRITSLGVSWLENEGNTAHLVAFWVGYDMAVGSCVRRSQAVQVALSLHPLAVLESKVASVDHIDCASRPQSMVEVHDPSQNRSVAPANRASVHQKHKNHLTIRRRTSPFKGTHGEALEVSPALVDTSQYHHTYRLSTCGCCTSRSSVGLLTLPNLSGLYGPPGGGSPRSCAIKKVLRTASML